jgi:hypothetical protein
MHKLWEIDEIVCLVVAKLEEHNKGNASALALACCSKPLSGMVLDSLWKDLMGLSQLMMCLPPDSWEIRGDEFVRTNDIGSLCLERAHRRSTGFLTLPDH